MGRAGIYNLARDYSDNQLITLKENVTDPHWVVAVIRLGQPLSFDRKTMASGSKDLSSGALLRAVHPLVITSDCLHLSVQNHKSSHMKIMQVTLNPDNVNYLVEVLPDDWVFAWIVNNREDFESLLSRIDDCAMLGEPDLACNKFNDGLKFVGRVDEIYKDTQIVDQRKGTKKSTYSLKCTSFRELETQLFYDYALATRDAGNGDFGWLARFGVSVDALFKENAQRGIQENNINLIIPTMLDLVLGHGPSRSGNINVAAGEGTLTGTPTLDRSENDPPYSYLVPVAVGNLLGRTDKSKGVMSYADILDLWIGVQSYPTKGGLGMFTPEFEENDKYLNRKRTKIPLLGTFLPFMPDFANRPLWQVFQQYVNHTINEIYTALKPNRDGLLVPTIVFRQIPFTTDAFVAPVAPKKAGVGVLNGQVLEGPLEFVQEDDRMGLSTTKFLDLPRWHAPAALVKRGHVGRSNATRVNFIHIYGTSSYLAQGGAPIQYQMLNNKPVRDDVDIMRSGIRPYMTTVECWVDDTVGKAPSKWMALVADWTIGSHLTFNGTIEMYGVQAPIEVGDNVSFDGVIYHIMGVDHMCAVDTDGGNKTWITVLQVTNGMRNTDALTMRNASTEKDLRQGLVPIYPGFDKNDNTALDPGLTLEHGHPTTGGDSERKVSFDDFDDRSSSSPLSSGDKLVDDNLALIDDETSGKKLKDLL